MWKYQKDYILLVWVLISIVNTEEWQLVFKVATGGSGTETLNMNNINAQSLTQPIKEHFKSDVINHWSSLDISQVKVSVYKNGTERAFFLFDGQGSSNVSWFSKDRLLNTSYTDLNTLTPTNYFSIEGNVRYVGNYNKQFYRRFFINANYAGCGADKGWLLVSDIYSFGDCDWERMYLYQKPMVMFSPLTTKSAYSQDRDIILADTMAIFVKFNSYVCVPLTSTPVQLDHERYCYQPTINSNVSYTTTNSVLGTTTQYTTTMSQTELQQKVDNLKQELIISRKSTTRYTRSVTSADDVRYSSKTIGILGTAIICIVIGLIILIDCINCYQKISALPRKKVQPIATRHS